MGSLQRRLEDLEEKLHAEDLVAHWSYEEWPADDQLEAVLDVVSFHRRFGSAYHATDREINILGICTAYEDLQGAGEWVAPLSGTVITLSDNGDETFNVSLSGNVVLEDLPEHIRPYVERLALEKQERRERWLYEDHHRSKQERELRREREKQAELVRLHILMRQATDSLHTQATEVYEMAKGLEELTKDTAIRYSGLRVRVEARATWEQATDLRRALEEMGKEMRGEAP